MGDIAGHETAKGGRSVNTAFVIQLIVMAFLWALAIWGAWCTRKDFRGILESQKKRAPR